MRDLLKKKVTGWHSWEKRMKTIIFVRNSDIKVIVEVCSATDKLERTGIVWN